MKTVSDKPFEVRAESEADYQQNLIANGLDAGTAAIVTSIQVLINSGDLNEQTSDLTDVLGRPQTDLASLIKSYK